MLERKHKLPSLNSGYLRCIYKSSSSYPKQCKWNVCFKSIKIFDTVSHSMPESIQWITACLSIYQDGWWVNGQLGKKKSCHL